MLILQYLRTHSCDLERNIDGIHAKNPYSMLTYLISSDPHFNPVKDMLYHFYFLKPGAIKWLTYVNRVNG